MNVLIIHNRYAYAGGEDEACATEIDLLRGRGHTVVTYEQDNRSIAQLSRISVARRAFWSAEAYRTVRDLIRRHRIDLMSVHNFFPLLSPSIFYAAAAERVPCVQTLHNYRLLCPGGMFLREGRVCEDCLGKAFPWPGTVHACYRKSVLQSAVTSGTLFSHRIIGTWSHKVTRYIALTEFMRQKMIEGGLPVDGVVVKPNSVEDSGIGNAEGDNFLFAGRLSSEKGVDVLLRAWGLLRNSGRMTRGLRIAGTGPEEMNARAIAIGWPEVVFLGQISGAALREEMGRAAAVVLPSIWYEGLSRVMIEAFSKGTPVIASRLGSMAEVLADGENGVLFNVGEAEDLAAVLERFPALSSDGCRRLRAGARSQYERFYSNEVVYQRLMEIYADARRDLSVKGRGEL